jgi:hypothetical protein
MTESLVITGAAAVPALSTAEPGSSYNSAKPPSTRGVYLAKRCFRPLG